MSWFLLDWGCRGVVEGSSFVEPLFGGVSRPEQAPVICRDSIRAFSPMTSVYESSEMHWVFELFSGSASMMGLMAF